MGFDNVWVGVEKLLDLARIDVLAAANNHVLDAPDNLHVALGVHFCQVARVQPARRVDGLAGALFIIPITTHHRIAPAAQLAGFAQGHHLAMLINDLDLLIGAYPTHGAAALFRRGINIGHMVDRTRLGLAIHDGDLAHIELVHNLMHQL